MCYKLYIYARQNMHVILQSSFITVYISTMNNVRTGHFCNKNNKNHKVSWFRQIYNCQFKLLKNPFKFLKLTNFLLALCWTAYRFYSNWYSYIDFWKKSVKFIYKNDIPVPVYQKCHRQWLHTFMSEWWRSIKC